MKYLKALSEFLTAQHEQKEQVSCFNIFFINYKFLSDIVLTSSHLRKSHLIMDTGVMNPATEFMSFLGIERIMKLENNEQLIKTQRHNHVNYYCFCIINLQ